MAHKLERKRLDAPDETRPFKDGKGRMEVVTVGSVTMGVDATSVPSVVAGGT